MRNGKVHKYLSMHLDFSTRHQVHISMVDYMKEIIETWDCAKAKNNNGFMEVKLQQKKSRISMAPVDEDSEKLHGEISIAFHNIVAKALYMVKRARPDASVAIAYLTT